MKSKLFSLIISVLAAMCLWVYVMTVVNPDVDLTIGNIPVTFSGAEVLREDHGLVITGDYQEFVSVHFYGKNADLKTLDQHKDEIKAVIDVSKVRSTKDYTRPQKAAFWRGRAVCFPPGQTLPAAGF